jgi:predicted ribosome quality control (RQC) complex YloA/Tae2 family protein
MSSAVKVPSRVQPLDGLTLYCLSKEWQEDLTSARIQKVQQLTRSDWLISFYGKSHYSNANTANPNQEESSRAGKLFFSLKAEMPFCCVFWGDKTASGFPDWLKPLPGNPSGFCMLLRKHLVGAKIRSISVLEGERVLNIEVENATELGYQSRVILSLELMGKHSNAILIQPESVNSGGKPLILGVAHTIGEHQSRYRELAGGLPYLPPPVPRDKIRWSDITPVLLNQWAIVFQGDLLEAETDSEILLSAQDWAEVLSQHVMGFGKQMLRQILDLQAGSSQTLSAQSVFESLPRPENEEDFIKADLIKADLTNAGYVLQALEKTTAENLSIRLALNNKKSFFINTILKTYYWPHYEFSHQVALRRKLEAALAKQFNQTQRRLDALKINQDTAPQVLQNTADRLLLALNTDELPSHPCQIFDDLNVLRQMESVEGETAAKWEAATESNPVTLSLDEVYSFHLTAEWQGKSWENPCLRLPHWEANQADFEILIRPDWTWMEHVQQLFKQVRKRKNRQKLLDQEGAHYEDRLVYLESVLCWLEQSDTVSELLTLQVEFETLGWLEQSSSHLKSNAKKKPQPESEMSGILTLKSSEGVPLWIGRTSEGNGRLLSRWAKPHDVWVHVHQMAGSHVLIRPLSGEPENNTENIIDTGDSPAQENSVDDFSYGLRVSNQTLLEALNLAVYYSVAREGSQVPVVFTEYRYVRKIPQSYPGHVTYKQEQQAYITPDFNLIHTLLKAVQGE